MKHIFFGAGKIGRMLQYVYGNEVAYFCDNHCDEKTIDGIPVIDFKKLQEIYREYNVVITVSERIQDEIKKQLDSVGIPSISYQMLDFRNKEELFSFGGEVAGRDAWVREALKRLPAGCRILDAGAGEQKYKKYCSHLNYVSQDFCQYDGVGDHHGAHPGKWDTSQIDIVSDIVSIPEADKSFDAILCTEVLEHIIDPEAAIREFSRLSTGGGTIDSNCSVLQPDTFRALSLHDGI